MYIDEGLIFNSIDFRYWWFQPDKSGNRFAPFRLDIRDTKATWMGGVPHSWEDQVDARNEGRYDVWIEAKRPGNKDFKDIPLAMGYPYWEALSGVTVRQVITYLGISFFFHILKDRGHN